MRPDAVFAALSVEHGVARAVVDPAHARALCEGHFPGDPLLPGAYLAGLMAEVARALVTAGGSESEMCALDRCLFLQRVPPEGQIAVTARLVGGARIEVEVHADGACAARAVLRFAPRP